MRTIIACCLAVFVLSGCAGLVAPFVNNPYAGTYNGTFTTSDGKSGTASIQLTKIGNVFGNLTDSGTGQTGTLNGSVDTHLVFNGTSTFSGASHAVAGTFTSSSGNVKGTLNGQGGYSITVDVAKQ